MNTQIVPLVERAIMERMRAKSCFTALDISNALKADRYPIRHREVAEIVRDIHASGAMEFYDFDRRLIDVVTEGGTKKTQAFLYLHDATREREYTARRQDSLPLVPDDQARDLSESVLAAPVPVLPRPQQSSHPTNRRSGRRSHCRRDGALTIPRALLLQLGWDDDDTLSLTSGQNGLTLALSPTAGAVRVWKHQRLRLCRRKLRLGGMTADGVILEIIGTSLQIQPCPRP